MVIKETYQILFNNKLIHCFCITCYFKKDNQGNGLIKELIEESTIKICKES